MVAIVGIAVFIFGLIFHNTAPPPIVPGQPEDVRRLQAALRDIGSRRAKAIPAILEVDEAELNSFIRSNLAVNSKSTTNGAEAALRDVKVKLDGDLVTVYVACTVRGKDMTFVVEGRLHSTDGYAEFDATAAQIGALPIPSSTLRSAMEQMRKSPQMRENLRLPGDVSNISVKNSKIVLNFK